MLQKKALIVILFTVFSIACKSQFYFDFQESKTFYNKATLLQLANVRKETVVVTQVKNKIAEDSFKIIVTRYNDFGNAVSTYTGSKWNPVSLTDSFQYNASGKQTHVSYKAKKVAMPVRNDDYNPAQEYQENDTLNRGGSRYEFDSSGKIKKVFYWGAGYKELLTKLVFYNDEGKVVKIDFAPESEKVLYVDYVYKKDKVKIFTVTNNGKSCDERIYFNEAGQVIKREVDFKRFGQWQTNTYLFTYTSQNLLETEKKYSDRRLFTEIRHQYEQ